MKSDLTPTRVRNLLKLYGLTAHQWLDLIRSGICPLCLKRYSATRRPVVDHAHGGSRPGLVRAATCMPCNYRLGLLHDDTGWLQRAAAYLSEPPAIALIGEVYVPGSPPHLKGETIA